MHIRSLHILLALLLVVSGLFLTIGAKGHWDFILPFRGAKLAGLILVGVSASTSTVLFQTITQNRILTPSIMGFDALYVFLLTLAVFGLGTQSLAHVPEFVQFLSSLVLLMLASLALFGTLLVSTRRDVMRMILTGIIFGVMFRALSSFLTRMIDPNEYAAVQINSYARFNRIDTDLLWIASILCGLALIYVWRIRHRLDVLSLGYSAATNLGERPQRATFQVLCVIAVLVSVSTALVGPIAFLGLLVVSLARVVSPSDRHEILLPTAGLISAIVLIGGQTVLERVLGLATPLSVVVDALGGVIFLLLLLRMVNK
ncbi:MAG: iron chelate uptake ABC transporter family permease subunit [Litoreibacter sp.]